MTRLLALIHICELDEFYFESIIFKHLDEKFTDQSILGAIQDMALSSLDTLAKCSFQQKAIDCAELFVPIFTDQGLCFAFNALNSHDIYTEEYFCHFHTEHFLGIIKEFCCFQDGSRYDDGSEQFICVILELRNWL